MRGRKSRTRLRGFQCLSSPTYTELLDPEVVPEAVLREMHGRSLSPSAFVLYLGCDCEPEELGITGSMTFLTGHTDISDKNLQDMQRLDLGDQFMALSCYDVADPDFSPAGDLPAQCRHPEIRRALAADPAG